MSENDNEWKWGTHGGGTENHSDSDRARTENHSDSDRARTENHSDSQNSEAETAPKPDVGKKQKPLKYNKEGLPTGTLILDRYQVLSVLGGGGMGIVHRCFDKISGTEVAVKMLPPHVSYSQSDMDDVKKNYALVSTLIHQNIAAYKTLEADSDGNYFLVMECVQGETLFDWMRRKQHEGRLTLKTALPVLRQIAAALDFAHERDIMHRDIKPDNVMLLLDGTVKVVDFGLASKIRMSNTYLFKIETGRSGTRQYKSPEQWRGSPQGPATDLYALAVLTYEMLDGRVPFDDEDPDKLCKKVLNQPPARLKGKSEAINEIVARGLAKDPAQRYPSCMDFVVALDRALRWQIVIWLWRFTKRHWRIILPVLLLLGLLAFVKAKLGSKSAKNKRYIVSEKMGTADSWKNEKKTPAPRKSAMSAVPEMVTVQAGNFWMGSEEAEAGRGKDETQHHVALSKNFKIGRFEVTQKQYRTVMGENPSAFAGEKRDDYPVECVSWEEAMAYCEKLTEQEREAGHIEKNEKYTLPTEAQWEYAARGGHLSSNDSKYSGSNDLKRVGWYDEGKNGSTHPVGMKTPNSLDVYDMSGNVWEWCLDVCDLEEDGSVKSDTYNKDKQYTDPCGKESIYDGDTTYRVIRGGSWNDSNTFCRKAKRSCRKKSEKAPNIGLRIVLINE